MLRAYILLLAALAAPGHGQRLDIAYGFPLYSPLPEPDDPSVKWKKSKVYLSAGCLLEPTAFIATGPRFGWSYWDFRVREIDADLEIRKWEFGWSVMPQKRLSGNARLFLDASIGFEYLDYSAHYPIANPGDVPSNGLLFSKSEWGFGRSLGMGLEYRWLQLSLHHDAFLAESLPGEFAGLRASIGLVWRKRP